MEVRKVKDFRSNGVFLSYPQIVVKLNIGRKWGLEAICKALRNPISLHIIQQFAYIVQSAQLKGGKLENRVDQSLPFKSKQLKECISLRALRMQCLNGKILLSILRRKQTALRCAVLGLVDANKVKLLRLSISMHPYLFLWFFFCSNGVLELLWKFGPQRLSYSQMTAQVNILRALPDYIPEGPERVQSSVGCTAGKEVHPPVIRCTGGARLLPSPCPIGLSPATPTETLLFMEGC